MRNILLKTVLIFCAVLSTVVFAEEDRGSLYRINNTQSLGGIRGLAAAIYTPRVAYKYTPATMKEGVLTVLAMTSYAVSRDNSVVALAESLAQEDGKYFNRIVFLEFSRFKIINGIEFVSDGKIKNMFFFYNKLIFEESGEKSVLKALVLSRNLSVLRQKIELSAAVSSTCYDNDFFYVKCADKKLLQLNRELKVNSITETRHNGGVIFIKHRAAVVTNFTQENLEQLHKSRDGVFSSNFKDLKDIPKPVSVMLPPGDQRNFYFTTADGELYILIDSTLCEKIDVSEFEMIFLHPFKREFYLLAKKKYMLEIVHQVNHKLKRKISHYSMRPDTHKALKFIIPHRYGVFLVTQKGEFVQFYERRRRYHKVKIQ